MLSTAEFPPLLPAGFHVKKISELEDMCVKAFPLSRSRSDIFNNLKQVVQHLKSASVPGKLWIDGSFMTHKIDPNDVDIVLETCFVEYRAASQPYRDAVDLIGSNLKHRDCDSYVCYTVPDNHADKAQADWMKAYWTRQFGFSRGDDFKGIAVIELDRI